MSTSPSEVLNAATRVLSQAHAAGDTRLICDDALQGLLAVAVRTYAARVEAAGPLPVFPHGGVTATEVAVVACAMLDAVDVGIFELSMWQTIKAPSSR